MDRIDNELITYNRIHNHTTPLVYIKAAIHEII